MLRIVDRPRLVTGISGLVVVARLRCGWPVPQRVACVASRVMHGILSRRVVKCRPHMGLRLQRSEEGGQRRRDGGRRTVDGGRCRSGRVRRRGVVDDEVSRENSLAGLPVNARQHPGSVLCQRRQEATVELQRGGIPSTSHDTAEVQWPPQAPTQWPPLRHSCPAPLSAK